MPSILHDFEVRADPATVFGAVTTPAGLDQWWTRRASGTAEIGADFALWFGPDADWRARVIDLVPGSRFMLEMTGADADWLGTRVGFALEPSPEGTKVRFSHTGWRAENDHFRTSSYCWAMYLRVMRRFVEAGENVPYDDRINM